MARTLAMKADLLSGWVPIHINLRAGRPTVDWGFVGSCRFTDPFFFHTVEKCVRHPADVLFRHQTALEALGDVVASRPSVQPTGFIFHMSRCGSTLVSQMLAALPQNIVLSEAAPIDEVLRAHFTIPSLTEEQQLQWLKWIIAALAQRREPGEEHLFIKFDCWHIMLQPLIQRAFPRVPWIFMYRNPLEVMASAQKQLGGQMIPGVLPPALFGWQPAEVQSMALFEYTARVLAKLCETALSHTQAGNGKLMNYTQLPQAIWPELARYWNLDLTDADLSAMLAGAVLDAKNPVLPFEPDSVAKREMLSADLRALTHQWLDDVYARLESQRQITGFA